MRLNELKEGEKIALEVIFQGESYEFTSSVLGTVQNLLLAEIVRSEGKVVGFNGTDIMVNLILYRKNMLPVVWKGVGCTVVEYKGNMQYKIVASGEGAELNRRQAFRLTLEKNGVAQIGMNRKANDVVVRDLSETGYSFIMEDDMDHPANSSVRLVFSDRDQHFTLTGIIVRREELSENKILYGCRQNVQDRLVSRYINEKQREKLAAKRQGRSDTSFQTIDDNILAAISEHKDKKVHKIRNEKLSRKVNEVNKEERRKIFKKW